MKEHLNRLATQTKDNIEQRRDLRFTIPGVYKEVEQYYEKYLKGIKPTQEEITRLEQAAKKSNRKNARPLKTDTSYEVAVTHHYNVLLAMAFSKAEKLFSELTKRYADAYRHDGKESGKKMQAEKKPVQQEEEETFVALSPIEALAISHNLAQGRNSAIAQGLKKGELKALYDYQQHLNVCCKALGELRNYHVHILHEPGPLRFENVYGDKLPGKNKLTQEEWDKAKGWFKGKWDEVQRHMLQSLSVREEEAKKRLKEVKKEKERKEPEKLLKDIAAVRETLSGYAFEQDGYVTHHALLFIACMFLRKSDAEYFVKKWTGLKRPEGPFRTTQTFFTCLSARDKKSLERHNVHLGKFRKAVSILSTMPFFNNKCFEPINKAIQEHNDKMGAYIKSPREKRERAYSNISPKELQAYMIPVRKNFSPAKWYLDYLNEKKLLDKFTVACYKTLEDRLQYLEQHLGGNNVQEWKLRMKKASGQEKDRYREVYKEGKRNFVFKGGASVNDDYCIKNDTAMIQYAFKGVTVQANLSCDVLMKWVFCDIFLGKGEEIKEQITDYMQRQYYDLYYDRYGKEAVDSRLPPSMRRTGKEDNAITVTKVSERLEERRKQLQQFIHTNSVQKAPWRFAAKRKMDIIFDYIHLHYTEVALARGKDIDSRRHEALNDMEYLDAMEYIRFYGKSSDMDAFKDFIKSKSVYFSGIADCLEKARTLEQLFDCVSMKLVRFYEKGIKQLKESNLEKYAALYKLKRTPAETKDNELGERFSVNQVIPLELIDVQKLAEQHENYAKWKEQQAKNEQKVARPLTDFSLMRFMLCQRNPMGTNTDYLMKVVMRDVRFPKNDRGTIEGNQTLFTTLMKNKMDELMVWEVAKMYWQMGTGKAFSESKENWVFQDGDRLDNRPYKKRLFFYHVFNTEVEVAVFGENKNESPVLVKISPKKFDDEFQFYESEELYHFINSGAAKKKNGVWEFVGLNKQLKDKVAQYLDDVYLLLTAEKHVVWSNYEYFTQLLHEKSGTKYWDGYQYIFGRKKWFEEKALHADDVEQSKYDNAIVCKLYELLDHGGAFTEVQLIDYRNRVLHQQVQRAPQVYEIIRKALVGFCVQAGLLVGKE